ncbi:hypothetical protein Hanom_Chr03g00278051 [Helianthus anomalus]
MNSYHQNHLQNHHRKTAQKRRMGSQKSYRPLPCPLSKHLHRIHRKFLVFPDH